MMNRLLVVALVCASSACTLTLDGESVLVRAERRFPVTGAPDVTITTIDGSIHVHSWDRNEVLVEVEKRAETEEAAEALEVRATQDGNAIRIEVPGVRGGDVFGFRSSVDLRVTVPANLTLRAQTGNGSIEAEGLDGSLELRTGDGNIRLQDVTGRADLSSGDGSINVRGRFEVFRADTGDGSMNIEVEDGSAMNEDWRLTTGDGSITLRVPDGLNADVDAQSGDGNIVLDGHDARARADGSDGNDGMAVLRTRLGAGGRTLLLRSGDGQIRLFSR